MPANLDLFVDYAPEPQRAPVHLELVPSQEAVQVAGNGELFAEAEVIPWKREWQNMPEYECRELGPRYTLLVHFTCEADALEFGRLVGDESYKPRAGRQRQSMWFPAHDIVTWENRRYRDAR